MKQRNTDIDWIRAILIILMILIHIVSFGNTYPQLKAGILSFMMPTFLIITGYLVNIEKSPKEMGRYLMCLALPYVIMVTGFSVLSYFMPVRDGITELSLSQICEKIFVTSIGPYWFIQTMIICGILYYVSFKGAIWGTLRQGKTTMSTTTNLFIFATLFIYGLLDLMYGIIYSKCRARNIAEDQISVINNALLTFLFVLLLSS